MTPIDLVDYDDVSYNWQSYSNVNSSISVGRLNILLQTLCSFFLFTGSCCRGQARIFVWLTILIKEAQIQRFYISLLN